MSARRRCEARSSQHLLFRTCLAVCSTGASLEASMWSSFAWLPSHCGAANRPFLRRPMFFVNRVGSVKQVSVLTVCAKPVARVTQSPASKGDRYGLFRRVAYRSPPFNRSICFRKTKSLIQGVIVASLAIWVRPQCTVVTWPVLRRASNADGDRCCHATAREAFLRLIRSCQTELAHMHVVRFLVARTDTVSNHLSSGRRRRAVVLT